MIREKEIKAGANDYIGHGQEINEGIEVFSAGDAFIAGAKWADEHPQNLFHLVEKGDMPEEHEEEMSKTIQHPEKRTYKVSNKVLSYDSLYGWRIDYTYNGKWASEHRLSSACGQIVHGVIFWTELPKVPENLLK